jgi:hypothetical protein
MPATAVFMVKDILRQAIPPGAKRKDMGARDYARKVEAPDDALTLHLRNRVFKDPENQRLPDAPEPTNNRAERDLRPAVIARKISQCPNASLPPSVRIHSQQTCPTHPTLSPQKPLI